MNAVTNFDLSVLDFIAEKLRCPALDFLMVWITKLGDAGIVPIIAAIALICISKTRKTGISMGIAIALGGIVGNLILKNAVGRIRPYDLVEGIELLVPTLSDFSFPSGHTLVTFEAATVLFVREKRFIGIPALILASLVAFSRLYLYVHYPTDVIAGAILGIMIGIFASEAVNRFFKAKTDDR